jgi:16S rRNA (adenine(1408)-N(1))-methyltransferase
VDVGTGDGRFVYQSARNNPDRFYIGIDASPAALEKISEKIHRKPAKGGAPNALFIQAAVEDLPSELDGIADEIHIHFPWGSLLRAVAVGDETVLKSLRRICAPCAYLEVVIGSDAERDRTEIARLGIPELSPEYIETELIPRYLDAGFEVTESGMIPASEWPHIETSWAQRLKGGESRSLIYIIAQAKE